MRIAIEEIGLESSFDDQAAHAVAQFGGRGIGEPTQGAAAAALASAISDALDGHVFNTAPTTTDMIINHLAGNDYSTKYLKTNTF